jgi:hypothetical protein
MDGNKQVQRSVPERERREGSAALIVGRRQTRIEIQQI